MYPMEPTETERLIGLIKDKSVSESEYIQEQIDKHDTTQMRVGVNYYFNESDILKRKLYRYEDGIKVEDDTKPNNRIPHGWHKLLVDQKTGYLVGQPINFAADNESFQEYINDYLGEKFDDIANELVKNASNKGVEWLHPYIDENGEFDFIITPAEQIIPIYAGEGNKRLGLVIRFYPITIDNVETIKVELWDENTVTFYIKQDGKYVLDPYEPNNPDSHFYFGTSDNEKGYGWGKVPFIPFKNNEELRGDIHDYKEHIDAFDLTVSDNQNAFEEFQNLIYVLKGYEGQSLSEFTTNLKFYKAVSVEAGEGSGVDTINNEIPMDSADKHLDRLRESIFFFGQGVDVGTDKFGNSPSGIALRFLYSLLELKASTLERKFRTSIQSLLWFLCEYLKMSGKGEFNYKEVDFTFKRTMLMNELEQAQIAQASKGVISDETIINNHPWVKDSEQELERLARQREENPIRLDDLEE